MKSMIQLVASILAAAALSITCGCVTSSEEFGVKPKTQMTVTQARRALAEALKTTHYIFPDYNPSVRNIKVERDRATWVEVIEGDEPHEYALVFADVKDMTVIEIGKIAVIQFSDAKALLGTNSVNTTDKLTAMKFVDAVLTLKAAALLPGSDESDFAAFSENAKVWLATTPRPEMSDDARTFKLLAEDAYKRQDFAAALDAYHNALDLYPMWPQGHFNAAHLAAELNDFGAAADHMRRYLVLVPDAKDARAAKDNLLLWRHKANKR